MCNIRVMKCNKHVYAIGQEDSMADKKEKMERCTFCDSERCEYRKEYLNAYWSIKHYCTKEVAKDTLVEFKYNGKLPRKGKEIFHVGSYYRILGKDANGFCYRIEF